MTFSKFKNPTGKYRYLTLYLSNKTANMIDKNWPVYNEVQGRQSHSFKTTNITLVGLQLER